MCFCPHKILTWIFYLASKFNNLCTVFAFCSHTFYWNLTYNGFYRKKRSQLALVSSHLLVSYGACIWSPNLNYNLSIICKADGLMKSRSGGGRDISRERKFSTFSDAQSFLAISLEWWSTYLYVRRRDGVSLKFIMNLTITKRFITWNWYCFSIGITH